MDNDSTIINQANLDGIINSKRLNENSPESEIGPLNDREYNKQSLTLAPKNKSSEQFYSGIQASKIEGNPIASSQIEVNQFENSLKNNVIVEGLKGLKIHGIEHIDDLIIKIGKYSRMLEKYKNNPASILNIITKLKERILDSKFEINDNNISFGPKKLNSKNKQSSKKINKSDCKDNLSSGPNKLNSSSKQTSKTINKPDCEDNLSSGPNELSSNNKQTSKNINKPDCEDNLSSGSDSKKIDEPDCNDHLSSGSELCEADQQKYIQTCEPAKPQQCQKCETSKHLNKKMELCGFGSNEQFQNSKLVDYISQFRKFSMENCNEYFTRFEQSDLVDISNKLQSEKRRQKYVMTNIDVFSHFVVENIAKFKKRMDWAKSQKSNGLNKTILCSENYSKNDQEEFDRNRDVLENQLRKTKKQMKLGPVIDRIYDKKKMIFRSNRQNHSIDSSNSESTNFQKGRLSANQTERSHYENNHYYTSNTSTQMINGNGNDSHGRQNNDIYHTDKQTFANRAQVKNSTNNNVLYEKKSRRFNNTSNAKPSYADANRFTKKLNNPINNPINLSINYIQNNPQITMEINNKSVDINKTMKTTCIEKFEKIPKVRKLIRCKTNDSLDNEFTKTDNPIYQTKFNNQYGYEGFVKTMNPYNGKVSSNYHVNKDVNTQGIYGITNWSKANKRSKNDGPGTMDSQIYKDGCKILDITGEKPSKPIQILEKLHSSVKDTEIRESNNIDNPFFINGINYDPLCQNSDSISTKLDQKRLSRKGSPYKDNYLEYLKPSKVALDFSVYSQNQKSPPCPNPNQKIKLSSSLDHKSQVKKIQPIDPKASCKINNIPTHLKKICNNTHDTDRTSDYPIINNVKLTKLIGTSNNYLDF